MRVFLWLATAVLCLWFGTPFVMAKLVPDAAMRGPTGDLYGSVNALFSGLAFAGLLGTLWLQREQLALQRDELRLQREELKAQRKEMAASRAELASQVAVQRSQFKASCAQLVATAQLVKVESIKLAASYMDNPHHELERISDRLMALADNVEQSGACAVEPESDRE